MSIVVAAWFNSAPEPFADNLNVAALFGLLPVSHIFYIPVEFVLLNITNLGLNPV